MKNFFLVIALLVSSCDSSATGDDGGSAAADVGGYTPSGVTTNLGPNSCADASKHPECAGGDGYVHCGWDPASNLCYPIVANQPPSCDFTIDWCEVYINWKNTSGKDPIRYAPGTIKLWGGPESRYLGDPDSDGPIGSVCVFNTVPYEVTSSSIQNSCH